MAWNRNLWFHGTSDKKSDFTELRQRLYVAAQPERAAAYAGTRGVVLVLRVRQDALEEAPTPKVCDDDLNDLAVRTGARAGQDYEILARVSPRQAWYVCETYDAWRRWCQASNEEKLTLITETRAVEDEA